MKFGMVTHIGPWQQINRKIFVFLKIHLEKSQKSRYLRNGLADLYEIWYADVKWAS